VSHGTFAPGLPAFAFDALRPAHSTAAGEAVWTYARTVVPLDSYVDGRDKVKVRVRRALR
jgi:hypothetical protein